MKKVRIQSPGTIANIVCGFDILGLALETPYDIMELEWRDAPGIGIEHLDTFGLPTDPANNVAGVVLQSMLEKAGNKNGFLLRIEKQIRPGSGIGSSAASAAGAAVAANQLMNSVFTNDELIQFAMQGEKLASGVKHADNIAPCLFGGVCLIRSIHPLDIIGLSAPQLYIAVVHPQIEVRTADARQILRQQVALKDAIKQWGNIAGLVTGLLQSDYDLIGRSLEDVLIEPVRSILIPGFQEIKNSCREAGALGGGIAGSGPSVFMLSRERTTATELETIMRKVYDRIGIDCNTYVTTINKQGVRVLPD